MNGSAKRLTAIIMVTAMIASAMVIVFTDEQDSSATTNNSFYYSFLDEGKLSKNLYNKLNELNAFDGTVSVIFSSADRTTTVRPMCPSPSSPPQMRSSSSRWTVT